MYARLISLVAASLLVLPASPVLADEYTDTVAQFRKAGESGRYFNTAYGYAVFPTIGKGGLGIGGAHGKGRVYEKGKYIGDTSMTQVTVGFLLGGQAFSQIIFFEDQRALREFTGGNFEFGAEASAVAITAGASAQAGTTGASAAASNPDKATTKGAYYKGMAVFTIPKGGLMFEAAIGGQKFNYSPRR
jgi:lipid-binding SYLF domain-containing protein